MQSYPELTNDQKAIILGTALGDGMLRFNTKARPGNSTAHLILGQGEPQLDYLRWKCNNLSTIISASILPFTTKGNLVGNRFIKPGSYYRVKSRQHPFLSYVCNLVYNDHRQKVFTEELAAQLTPLALAVWYMDDGQLTYGTTHNRQYARLGLSTESFDLENNNHIRDYFLTMGINFYVRPHANHHRLICNDYKSIQTFVNLVTPHVFLPLFQYKIDLIKDQRSRYTFPCGLSSVFPYFPEEVTSQGSPTLETLHCPFLSRGAKKEC
jgi:recombination protein RecA